MQDRNDFAEQSRAERLAVDDNVVRVERATLNQNRHGEQLRRVLNAPSIVRLFCLLTICLGLITMHTGVFATPAHASSGHGAVVSTEAGAELRAAHTTAHDTTHDTTHNTAHDNTAHDNTAHDNTHNIDPCSSDSAQHATCAAKALDLAVTSLTPLARDITVQAQPAAMPLAVTNVAPPHAPPTLELLGILRT